MRGNGVVSVLHTPPLDPFPELDGLKSLVLLLNSRGFDEVVPDPVLTASRAVSFTVFCWP